MAASAAVPLATFTVETNIMLMAVAPGFVATATSLNVTVRTVSSSPDGLRLGTPVRTVDVPAASELVLSQDGAWVFVMQRNSNVLTMASLTRPNEQPIPWALEGVPTPIYDLHVATNGVLAVVSYNAAHFFDLASRSLMNRADHQDMLETAFSPDGRFFAFNTSYDAHLWFLFPSCNSDGCGIEQSKRTTQGTFTCERCGASGPHETAQQQGLINHFLFETDNDNNDGVDVSRPCLWTDRVAFLRRNSHTIAIMDTREIMNTDRVQRREVRVPANTEFPVWIGADAMGAIVGADVCRLDLSGAKARCTHLVQGNRRKPFRNLRFEPETKMLTWLSGWRDIHVMRLA